ncbi:MAG: HlyD family efflux transporter periplasmic adaptor subunit [Bacteroidota bacterium]
MLNISHHSVTSDVKPKDWSGLIRVDSYKSGRLLLRIMLISSVIFLAGLFLPWTQNIRTQGSVTTLLPQQRPQSINTIIGGKIDAWYVREGDRVEAGDTILHLTEIKSEYFDPQLLERTQNQINAKSSTATAYQSKANMLEGQIVALRQSRDAKLEQAVNKLEQAQLTVVSDSIDLVAKQLNQSIAKDRYDRQLALYNKGLKSLTDLEKRELELQKTQAEELSGRNKLQASRASLVNAKVEISAIEAKYQEDLAKAQSDRFSALSNRFDADGTITKLQNEYANYEQRSQFYYVTAPQDGIITRTTKAGIGEIIKEGDEVATIMPANYQLAVELYIRPIDLPLLDIGQDVRILFDGWPAIVFSGWPNTSYGTFGGEVFAIDQFISDNGFYRILVAQSESEPWPDLLRVGGGANGLVLLKDVQVWYEIWRNLNGFPPDFYTTDPKPRKDIKLKAK